MRASQAAQPEPDVDRRRDERFETQLVVQVAEHHTIDKQLRDYLQEIADNVSLGGLFIRTPRPFSKGTSMQLELRLASDGSSAPGIRANAIVRWVKRWGGDAGMGVEFLDFEMNGRDDLDRFLKLVRRYPDVAR